MVGTEEENEPILGWVSAAKKFEIERVISNAAEKRDTEGHGVWAHIWNSNQSTYKNTAHMFC
jgi:hypothetical protein